MRRPWRPGESGNPRGGRSKSITTLIREALGERQLCDEPVPGGRTVAEALAEAMLRHAIKGNPAYMKEIMDRIDPRADLGAQPASPAAAMPTVYIPDNGRLRGDPAPEGTPGAIPCDPC